MQVHKYRRLIPNPAAPNLSSYHQGPVLTNGALEFIYNKPVTWPLYTLWGIGIRTIDQFNTLASPQLRSELAVTTAPIVGPGYPAGAIALQQLIDESGANDAN